MQAIIERKLIMYTLFHKKPLLVVTITLILAVLAGSLYLLNHISQAYQQAPFTMFSNHIFVPADNQDKKLYAIGVRFQNAAGSWRQVNTYLNDDGTVHRSDDTGGYLEPSHSVGFIKNVKSNPNFDREDYVLGHKTYVLRYGSDTSYREDYYAPGLQGMIIKSVTAGEDGKVIIEATRIEVGKPLIRLWSE
jgi:hypothetical protein